MSKASEGFPINRENMAAVVAWAESVPEQARRAMEANGPRIAAAFESFRDAIRR